MAKWPTQYEATARQDSILSDEFDWWKAWADDYVSGRIKARASLIAAMDRLKEDPQTKKEIEEQEKQEIQDGLDKKALEEALAEALAKNPSLLKPCTSVTQPGQHMPGLDVGVSGKTAERARRLAEEQLSEDQVIKQQFPHGEGAPGDIVNLKPTEDEFSRDQYKPPNQGLVQRMKTSFLMRPSALEWTDRLQKGGSIDEDEIWRAGAGDMRFFERRVVESAPDTSIALLVDMSGSMSGRKLRSASDAASIIHACTKEMRGVRVRVYGHTGDSHDSGDGNSVVYRIWEPGDPVTRLGTMMTQSKGDNYDGYALGWTVQQLIKHSTPEEQQIVFIISDGLPNGYGAGTVCGYGGDGAMDHIRDVVRWAERQGVDVIQIAIDPSLRAEEQARMYKHWVPFEDANMLPGQVMGILKKLM
jgi:Mg-chelatase subunit ChlD